MTTRKGKSIAWSSYNYPTEISDSSRTFEYSYGGNREKWKLVYTIGSSVETSIYVGSIYEKNTNSSGTDYRHYVEANGRAVAMVIINNSSDLARYIHTDYQGSTETITLSNGALKVNENFSAFGERRDPTDWSGAPVSADVYAIADLTDVGYTGHQNLINTSLVHMKGRVFDAHIGRSLSADPYIPDPMNPQAFNRYSYVYNNPMSYTDPNGFCPECAIFVADAIFSGVVTEALGGFFGALGDLFGGGNKPPPPNYCELAGPTGCGYVAASNSTKFISDTPTLMLSSLTASERVAGVVGRARLAIDDYTNERGFVLFLVGRVVQDFVLVPIEDSAVAIHGGDYVMVGVAVAGAVFKPVRAADKVVDTSRAVNRSAPNGRPASSVNAGDALNRKLRALEGAQQNAVRSRTLPDGRTRYYGPETPATNPGPTRGRSVVTEYDPKTGNVRQWMENYDHAGNVVRVRPSMRNGEVLRGQHYPPTGRELGQ